MNTDEWWRAKLLFDLFNTACKNIAAIFLKVGDESMRAIRFRTTEKGSLPHLSYIPEAGACRYRVQDSCLLCNRGIALCRSAKGKERDEGQLLPAGSRCHCGVYEADDGGNKGERSEV